jgi:hypothetical protein
MTPADEALFASFGYRDPISQSKAAGKQYSWVVDRERQMALTGLGGGTHHTGPEEYWAFIWGGASADFHLQDRRYPVD